MKNKIVSQYIINRANAIRSGSIVYDGRPCPKHYSTKRYTSYCGCVDCAKEAAERSRNKTRETIISARNTTLQTKSGQTITITINIE